MPRKAKNRSTSIKDVPSNDPLKTPESQKGTLAPSRVALIPPELFGGLRAFLIQSQDQAKTYLVLEKTFCSCPDFISRSLLRPEKPYCYHIEGLNLIRSVAKDNDIGKVKQLSNFFDIHARVPWF